MLVVVKFKDNMFNKFINFVNSNDGLEERKNLQQLRKVFLVPHLIKDTLFLKCLFMTRKLYIVS